MSVLWAVTSGLVTPAQLVQLTTDLQIEQSYLVNSLAFTNLRANELIRRMPPMEEILRNSMLPKQKRKAKKQLGWLKYRLGEAGRQEQTILQRLGQLAWEYEQRKRLSLLEEERRLQKSIVSSICPKAACLKLDPTVPEFHPSSYQQHMWQPPGSLSAYVPWPCNAKNSVYHSGKNNTILSPLVECCTLTPTLSVEEVNDVFDDQISLDEPEEVKEPSHIMITPVEGNRRPLVVHRSASTGDLQTMILPSRRNSLPHSTKRDRTSERGMNDTFGQDEQCEDLHAGKRSGSSLVDCDV